MSIIGSQRAEAHALLEAGGIRRLAEFRARGVTAATLSRMVEAGEAMRLSRGLYQKPDAAITAQHSLAESAKRVPKGVICLISALVFHQISLQLPRDVWMAVGLKNWLPRGGSPRIRAMRFADQHLHNAVETVEIEGVPVKVFGVAKTVADCFRHRSKVGLPVAIEGLKEALRQRKATPAEIAEAAMRGGVWSVMRPYVEALTADG
ncbi:MAG: transcriptional regulator [Hyphomicrobiales bacterium]|nr:transcriptional regulator [Hyphomicrobiales bacterium]